MATRMELRGSVLRMDLTGSILQVIPSSAPVLFGIVDVKVFNKLPIGIILKNLRQILMKKFFPQQPHILQLV